MTARSAGSLVFPDKSNQNGDSDFRSLSSEKSRQISTKNASNLDTTHHLAAGCITESNTVVLSLPSTMVVSRQNSSAGSGSNSHHQQKSSKNGGKKMSKRQKLLRKRAEAEMAKKLQKSPHFAEYDDELDQKDVKVKYSIDYFSWAVSDSDESDQEEDDKVIAVTLPLKNMRL